MGKLIQVTLAALNLDATAKMIRIIRIQNHIAQQSIAAYSKTHFSLQCLLILVFVNYQNLRFRDFGVSFQCSLAKGSNFFSYSGVRYYHFRVFTRKKYNEVSTFFTIRILSISNSKSLLAKTTTKQQSLLRYTFCEYRL